MEAWAPGTETGDRGEVEDLPDGADFWREISAASENCIGAGVSRTSIRAGSRACAQRALEADLVVVNHHLLCADLAVKDGSYGSVIPDYDTVDPRRGPSPGRRRHPVLRDPGLLASGGRPLP